MQILWFHIKIVGTLDDEWERFVVIRTDALRTETGAEYK